MKSVKMWYWILTGLICALMLFSSVPSIVPGEDAIKFFAGLGYPAYIIPFLSVAKILGVIGILVPGYPRIREWAYAGLTFDLVGAIYSALMVAPDPGGTAFLLAALGVLLGSYYLAHRKDRVSAAEGAASVVI